MEVGEILLAQVFYKTEVRGPEKQGLVPNKEGEWLPVDVRVLRSLEHLVERILGVEYLSDDQGEVDGTDGTHALEQRQCVVEATTGT